MYYKYKSQAKFENDLNNGLIDIKTAIVFIEKPKCIWTHGEYWLCYDQTQILTREDILDIVNKYLLGADSPFTPSIPGGTGEGTVLGPNTVTTEHIKNGTIKLEDLDVDDIEVPDDEVVEIWGTAMDAARNKDA